MQQIDQPEKPDSLYQLQQQQEEEPLAIDTSHYYKVIQTEPPSVQKRKECLRQLSNHGIIYNSYKEGENKYQIKLDYSTRLRDFWQLRVDLGPFMMGVKVMREDRPSPAHSLSQKEGAFGSVSFIQGKEGNHWAIKCCRFLQEEFQLKFSLVVKEYCMFRIAEALGVGPRLGLSTFGFDIILYSDCAQFLMERCLSIDKMHPADENILRDGLSTLHSFGVVHMDIKRDNLAVSARSGEPLFIDFGGSNVITEDLGDRTMSLAAGTLGYISEEMLRAYDRKRPTQVDLYANDVEGLAKSLAQVQQISHGEAIDRSQFSENQYIKGNDINTKVQRAENQLLQIFGKNSIKARIVQGNIQINNQKEMLVKNNLDYFNQFLNSLPAFLPALQFQEHFNSKVPYSREKNYHHIARAKHISLKSITKVHHRQELIIPEKTNSNDWYEKFSPGYRIFQPVLNDFNLTRLENESRLVTVEKLAKQLGRQEYEESLVKLVVLTNSELTFPQKVLAARIFLTSCGEENIQGIEDKQILVKCYINLLGKQEETKSSILRAPNIIISLIILQAIQVPSIIKCLLCCFRRKYEVSFLLVLVSRCLAINGWLRISLREDYYKLFLDRQIQKLCLIQLKAHRTKTHYEESIIRVYLNTVVSKKQIKTKEYYETQYSKLADILGRALKNEDYLNIRMKYLQKILSDHMHCLASSFQFVALIIQEMIIVDQQMSRKARRIDSYHLLMLQYAHHTSDSILITDIGNLLRTCVGHLSLIRGLNVYWISPAIFGQSQLEWGEELAQIFVGSKQPQRYYLILPFIRSIQTNTTASSKDGVALSLRRKLESCFTFELMTRWVMQIEIRYFPSALESVVVLLRLIERLGHNKKPLSDLRFIDVLNSRSAEYRQKMNLRMPPIAAYWHQYITSLLKEQCPFNDMLVGFLCKQFCIIKSDPSLANYRRIRFDHLATALLKMRTTTQVQQYFYEQVLASDRMSSLLFTDKDQVSMILYITLLSCRDADQFYCVHYHLSHYLKQLPSQRHTEWYRNILLQFKDICTFSLKLQFTSKFTPKILLSYSKKYPEPYYHLFLLICMRFMEPDLINNPITDRVLVRVLDCYWRTDVTFRKVFRSEILSIIHIRDCELDQKYLIISSPRKARYHFMQLVKFSELTEGKGQFKSKLQYQRSGWAPVASQEKMQMLNSKVSNLYGHCFTQAEPETEPEGTNQFPDFPPFELDKTIQKSFFS